MHRDVHDVLSRRAATLLPDALGAASLCVTFLALLFIPGLF